MRTGFGNSTIASRSSRNVFLTRTSISGIRVASE
jgi:hypothetical protein